MITSGYIQPRDLKSVPCGDDCTREFTSALFFMAGIREHPECLSTGDQKTRWCMSIDSRILGSLEREGHAAICYNMPEPGGHCAE